MYIETAHWGTFPGRTDSDPAVMKFCHADILPCCHAAGEATLKCSYYIQVSNIQVYINIVTALQGTFPSRTNSYSAVLPCCRGSCSKVNVLFTSIQYTSIYIVTAH